MSRLITPSLLGSIAWYKDCPTSWKEKATTDLHNTLARVWDGGSVATELGQRFEATVYSVCRQTRDAGSEHFKWFVAECQGGVFQKKSKQLIVVDDAEYCLYGKLDVWFPDIIKDIKTTSNYKGAQKYLSTFQHKQYCFTEGINKFRYLVAEFDESQKILAHYPIDYEAPDKETLKEEIVEAIRETVAFLKTNEEWFKLYTTVFSKY